MIRARFSMRFLFVLVAFAAVGALVLSWLVRSGVGSDMLQVAVFALVALGMILVAHGLVAILARALTGGARMTQAVTSRRSPSTDAPSS